MVYTLIKDGLSFPVFFQSSKILPETIRDKESNTKTYDCISINQKYLVVREEIKDKFIEEGIRQGFLKEV